MVLLLLLGACARPVGDLGRAEPSVVNDTVMPALGDFKTWATGTRVSALDLTDDERDMANRIWRFMTSGNAHDWFFDVAAELHRTRLTNGYGKSFPPDIYFNWLHHTPYQSANGRYATMQDDVDADVATLPDTFASICRVERLDRQRAVAAANLPTIGAATSADVAARAAENRDQIDRFTRAVRYRYQSYSFALDHLLVETPDPQARGVNASLTRLQHLLRQAQRGAFCAGSPPASHVPPPAIGLPSRFRAGNPLASDPAVAGS